MQFDVYRNPSPRSRDHVPYLLDVQADLLDDLATRVVVPLLHHDAAPNPVRILNPVLQIEGREVVCSTAEIAGIPTTALGEKVANLADQRHTIVAALDLLFTGI
jgi:toxin CcdB